MSIGGKRDRLDVCHQICQLGGTEALGMKEEPRRSWTALCLKIGIVPVPLVRGRFGNPSQRTIQYSVVAQLRGLEVPS